MENVDITKIRQCLKRIEKYYNDLNDDLYAELDKIRSFLIEEEQLQRADEETFDQ